MNARQILLWYLLALIIAQILFYEQLNNAFDSWRMQGCEQVWDIDAYDLKINLVNGDLWGIRYDSLFQYDGSQWYFHNVPSLKPGYVTDAFITFDPEGRMWQGGQNGVSVFADGHWTYYEAKDWGLAHTVVTSIAFEPDGKPWVGLSASFDAPQELCGGVSILDAGRWITYAFKDISTSGPGCQNVQSIQFDSSGNAWVGLSNGTLMILESKQDEGVQNALPGGPVFSSTLKSTGYFQVPEQSLPNADDTGPIVITDFSTGALVIPLTHDRWVVGAIHSILFDKHGDPWINAGESLYQLTDDSLILARFPSTRAAIDAEGNVWSVGQGVSVYDGSGWKIYHAGNSCIGNEDVHAIAFDKNNRGWFARFPHLGQEFSLSIFEQPPHRVPDVILRLRAIFLPPTNPWLRWLGPVLLIGAFFLVLSGAKWPAFIFPFLNIVLALVNEKLVHGQYSPSFIFEYLTFCSLVGGLIGAIIQRRKMRDGFWKNIMPGLYGTLIGALVLMIAGVLFNLFWSSS